jgi:hypothetical protein
LLSLPLLLLTPVRSSGMQACRDAAFQANKERLERERTVASKIAQA